MTKKNGKKPLYDCDLIRAEMARQRVTIALLSTRCKLGTPTITKVRQGRDVRISTLRKIHGALGIRMVEEV